MKDNLGQRMKDFYENRTRHLLPRRTYTIIRIDGKAFHSYTKGLTRPFDDGLIEDMDNTAIYLCNEIQGTKFAFVQSDEISILLTDFDKISTDAWFDGNIQKICSISASLATSKFNQLRLKRNIEFIFKYSNISNLNETFISNFESFKFANFDSRTFTIPSKNEVINYFIWRQQDCIRNSINSVAHSLYSYKDLNGKNINEIKEMCLQKNVNWDNFNIKLKNGRFIEKEIYINKNNDIKRTIWVSNECPSFIKNKEFLKNKIIDNI